jgi:hypothetical protein
MLSPSALASETGLYVSHEGIQTFTPKLRHQHFKGKMSLGQAPTSHDAGDSRITYSCSWVQTFDAAYCQVLQTAHQPAPTTPLYSMERATEIQHAAL